MKPIHHLNKAHLLLQGRKKQTSTIYGKVPDYFRDLVYRGFSLGTLICVHQQYKYLAISAHLKTTQNKSFFHACTCRFLLTIPMRADLSHLCVSVPFLGECLIALMLG